MRIAIRTILIALIAVMLAPSLMRADESDTKIKITVNPVTVPYGQAVGVTVKVNGCPAYVTLFVGPYNFNVGRNQQGNTLTRTFYVSGLPPGDNSVYATNNPGGSCSWDDADGPTIHVIPPVKGYVNPKYIVLGVDYVVPGSKSSATYCSDTSRGTTNSILSTFTSTYQQSFSIKIGAGISGWLNGSETDTTSQKYEQSSSDGKSVTITQTSNSCAVIPGPQNDYQPNSHDFDIIQVWLNPVVVLEFMEDQNGNITGTQWDGYGFNMSDQPAMDVAQIYVGCLNGDLPTGPGTSCANNLAPLQRAWDTYTTWPSGQGPALNSQDLANILAQDPFGMCTPDAGPTYPQNNCTIIPQPDRFTVTENQNVQYAQPIPGAQPTTQTYSLNYAVADTQSQDNTIVNSTTYGVEDSLQAGGGSFIVGWTVTTGNSQTFSTTVKTSQSLTTQNSNSESLSVTGPACVVSGGVCNPLYPSLIAPGPTEFDVYEDTMYGTFLLYPATWWY